MSFVYNNITYFRICAIITKNAIKNTYKKYLFKVKNMDKKIDVLNREPFIEKVIQLIDNIADKKQGCCFGIDGAWGSGKSFILERIEKKVAQIQLEKTANNKYLVFHYDCWKYDYYEEPIVAIVASMLDVIREEEKLFHKNEKVVIESAWKNAKEVIGDIASEICKNKIGIDFVEIAKDIKEDANRKLSDSHEFDEMYAFKKTLDMIRKKIDELSVNKTIVIVVDELDRCLPTYSIKVLERLHHLFADLKDVIVIVSMDKKQLSHSIKEIYGDIEVDIYLRKFIAFKVDLDNGIARKYEKKYSSYFSLFEMKEENIVEVENFLINILKEIDVRTQEKIFRKAEIIHTMIIEKKVDYSILMFEILFLIIGLKMKTYNIKWLGRLCIETFNNAQMELGVKYYDMLCDYEKKGRSINMITQNTYAVTGSPYGRMFFWIAKVFDEIKDDKSGCYYSPELCKQTKEINLVMRFADFIEVIDSD